MKHYLQFIQDTMWANWNEPALTDYEGSYDYTYGDLAIKVRKLQLLFDVLGILPGDKIAIGRWHICPLLLRVVWP